MELKSELKQPFTDEERMDFIVKQNHINGYEIRTTQTAIQAYGLTEKEKAAHKRERLDELTLTPTDVERALYKAKGMDFEDLKTLISEKIPSLDSKALGIEFRAKDFYRGAKIGEVRLFDTIGELLGYTLEDIDYLFVNKILPDKETPEPLPE